MQWKFWGLEMLGMDWICPIFRLCGRLERRFWVLVLKEALRKLLQIGSCSKSLQFFPPVEKDGQVLVQPPRAVLVDGAKQWNNALVVNFLGKSPSLPVFQRTVDKLWGREGSVEIDFISPSVYLVNFPSSRVRDWVFESGPWHIQQKTLILRKWTPGLLPEVLNLKTAPIWIRLWHVPLELYSQEGLSYLASALGKSLYTDKATTLRQHLEFAKICVEVDAKFTLPSSVLVDLGDDNVIAVGVELVWAPPKCSHCSIFGHLEEKCARSVVVDDSAQLNASNGIVKLETVVSTNLVDFVKDIVVSMGDAVLSPNKFDALATTAVEQVECLFLLVRLQVELRSY
ncbi:hypothetical protein V6N13_084982 [Hibiscus sabdariffa]